MFTHCNKSYVHIVSLSKYLIVKFNAFPILTKHLYCAVTITAVVCGTIAKLA